MTVRKPTYLYWYGMTTSSTRTDWLYNPYMLWCPYVT